LLLRGNVGKGAGVREILIATGNPGKFREIAAVLSEADGAHGALPVRWLRLDDLDRSIREPVEDQATFSGNAARKAVAYSLASGLWTLADDSGLEVDALGGAPGVQSARYAGSPDGAPRVAVDSANNAKLMAALSGVPEVERTARFRCVMVLADGERVLAETEGVIEGRIVDVPRGDGGFGYDPHFLVPELGVTTAELPATRKNAISHRGQALRRMREVLRGLVGV